MSLLLLENATVSCLTFILPAWADPLSACWTSMGHMVSRSRQLSRVPCIRLRQFPAYCKFLHQIDVSFNPYSPYRALLTLKSGKFLRENFFINSGKTGIKSHATNPWVAHQKSRTLLEKSYIVCNGKRVFNLMLFETNPLGFWAVRGWSSQACLHSSSTV